jgi:hypothetical protein
VSRSADLGHPVAVVQIVHVEALERALLDGVKVDGVQLDDVLGDDQPADGGRMRVDLGLIPVFSDERPLLGLAGLIDWRGSGRLSALIRSGFCTAAVGEQLLLPCDRRLPVGRLVLVGLGPRASFDDAQARAVARQLVKISAGLRAHSVLIALPTKGIDRALTEALFEALLISIEESSEAPDPAPPPEPVDAAIEALTDPLEVRAEATAERSEPLPEPAPERVSELPGDHLTTPESAPGSDADATLPPVASEHPGAAPASPTIVQAADVTTARWWVAVDEAVVARLKRVLSGPPRAARGGPSLHT